MSVRKMTMTAMMTCIIIVCSWITIPFTVPFTLQTFAVFFALLILGGKDGLLSVCLYIMLGAVGLPVFSGFRGGIGHLMGPTGGYIFGFIAMAFIYLLFEPIIIQKRVFQPFILFIGLCMCYLTGTIWFGLVYNGNDYNGFWGIASVCVFPYVAFDILKLGLAFIIAKRVNRLVSVPEK